MPILRPVITCSAPQVHIIEEEGLMSMHQLRRRPALRHAPLPAGAITPPD